MKSNKIFWFPVREVKKKKKAKGWREIRWELKFLSSFSLFFLLIYESSKFKKINFGKTDLTAFVDCDVEKEKMNFSII